MTLDKLTMRHFDQWADTALPYEEHEDVMRMIVSFVNEITEPEECDAVMDRSWWDILEIVCHHREASLIKQKGGG